MTESIYKVLTPPPQEQDNQLDLNEFFNKLINPEVKNAIQRANRPTYLHWEQLRYKNWIPQHLFPKKESFWFLLKFFRKMSSTPTPIKDAKGNYFKILNHLYEEFLHITDKEMAGNFMGVTDLSESDKKRVVVENLIEESIASSQLEGANTSRVVAKKMLIEGRKPQNHDEHMIVNNHRTMLRIEQELYKEPLSLELLCELHAMITDKTLEAENQGKLRDTFDKTGQRLKVIKPGDGEIAYIAPDKEFVETELPRLIAFANDNAGDFLHPLIKAIMLHFWVGLLHPFEDGNGRLARILFYWYMLKNGYWAFAYISLSEKIKKSPAQYSMAYIYSEQDDNDLTYFLDYNFHRLALARTEFQEYIKKQLQQNRSAVFSFQKDSHLNERQIKLLQYFNKNKQARTSIVAHQNIYLVKKNTAIADLKLLCSEGFLLKKKHGRNVFYYPTDKISELFNT